MTPNEIDIHPAAIQEARKAYRWYLRRSPSAASRFQAAFEASLAQIAESPDRWPSYLHGTRYRHSVVFGSSSCIDCSATDCRSSPWPTANESRDTGKGANLGKSSRR